jgi:hypothetical protein
MFDRYTKFVLRISIILAVLSCVISLQAQPESEFKKYAGNYVTGHEWGGGSIKLDNNGNFFESAGSDDGTAISTSGTYRFENGLLIFSITRKTISRGGGKVYNLLDPIDLKEWSLGNDTEIDKQFKLLPIEWSGRIYLIYETDLKNFVNAINLGIEPRPWLTSDSAVSPWFGSFYLRSGDQRKKVLGRPDLPKEWRAFELSHPVIAKVVKVISRKQEKYGLESIVVINKGTNDGLTIGMLMVARKEIPSLGYGTQVASVGRTTATVKSTMYPALKVGDKLSSRYEPSPILRRMRTLEMQIREKSENLK